MAKAIRGHNFGATVAIALLAAALLLVAGVFAVRQFATATERVGTPTMSADLGGGSSFKPNPYVDSHAAVVARYRNRADKPAMSQDNAGESSLTRDPAIERHAEIIARHNQSNLRWNQSNLR